MDPRRKEPQTLQLHLPKRVICEKCGYAMHHVRVDSKDEKGRIYLKLPIKYCLRCKHILMLTNMIVVRNYNVI